MSQVTILIIDDHEGFRSSARTLLEADGYRVVGEAGDGMSGLRIAAELRPDVVLLDVELPDIDGFDVAARLASGEGPQVVLVSSREFGGSGPVERSGARGCSPLELGRARRNRRRLGPASRGGRSPPRGRRLRGGGPGRRR